MLKICVSSGLKHFTPHMLTIEWDSVNGWSAPVIGTRQKLALDPASSVLHYGTACFEGCKAYKGKDGKTRLFRPYVLSINHRCSRLIEG